MRIAAGLACLIGCRAPGPAADLGTGGELRTFILDNPRSLDPVDATDTLSVEVAGQIFEGLLQYRPYDPAHGLKTAPAIAERWEILEDGRLFRFFLRAGVSFHDDPCFADGRGREVVASDVTFTMSRFVREGRSGDIGLLLEMLEGARDYREGRAPGIAGIREENARTVTFRLTRPWPGFLFFMLHQPAWLVPHEAITTYADRFAEHPVGTGPFRLAEWSPASHVLLVRNERYWERDAAGTPLPYLDQIRLRLQKGLDVRLAFDTGRADVGAGTTRFRRTHRTFPVERNNTIGFGFNLSEPTPYARIPQLRRAMATAIAYDRVKPVRAFTVLPPGFAEFDGSRRGPAQDMAAAKEMLAKAGYPGGQGLPPLVVLFPQREAGGYDAVLDSWKELGIPIVPELVSGAQHWERIERGEAAAFRWGVVSGAEPAETVYSYFWSRTPYRGFEYRSAEYDAAFEAFLQADPARRRELAARLEDILGRDLPVIPVRRDIALWFEATQSWVHGYAPSVNPAGLRFFKIVRLGERAP